MCVVRNLFVVDDENAVRPLCGSRLVFSETGKPFTERRDVRTVPERDTVWPPNFDAAPMSADWDKSHAKRVQKHTTLGGLPTTRELSSSSSYVYVGRPVSENAARDAVRATGYGLFPVAVCRARNAETPP